METRFGCGRQCCLGLRDRLIEVIAHAAFDESNEGLQCLARGTFLGKAKDFAFHIGSVHQAELVPARKVHKVMHRHGQRLSPALVGGVLAKSRRDHGIDDAIVEGIACDADAGMAKRFRLAALAEMNDRKVAGAATEIADEYG